MNATPIRAEEPVYELTEGGSTLRVYPHDHATLDDLLTVEINGPADSVRLSWSDVLELSDGLRDAMGQGTFKADALREAGKRDAVNALRRADVALGAFVRLADGHGNEEGFALARVALGNLTRRIESGEVTLP